jgi:predicted negative regulator of RcsB-dependent stress response
VIDDFYNEDEQWQRVKRWLRENGPWMVAGVVIGLGALYGWRWWEARAQDQAIAASDAYQAVIVRLEGNDFAAAIEAADALRAEHSDSAYAQQADLLAARIEVDRGNFGEASTRLERVMTQASDPQLQLIARQRLARVQIAQGNADAALATLAAAEPGAFAARFAEARGDALYAKGDLPAALSAWREAEAEGTAFGGVPTVDYAGLRLKIADLVANGVQEAAVESTPSSDADREVPANTTTDTDTDADINATDSTVGATENAE